MVIVKNIFFISGLSLPFPSLEQLPPALPQQAPIIRDSCLSYNPFSSTKRLQWVLPWTFSSPGYTTPAHSICLHSKVLQPSDNFCRHALDSFQQVCVFHVLRTPDPVFQLGSHKSGVARKNRLPKLLAKPPGMQPRTQFAFWLQVDIASSCPAFCPLIAPSVSQQGSSQFLHSPAGIWHQVFPQRRPRTLLLSHGHTSQVCAGPFLPAFLSSLVSSENLLRVNSVPLSMSYDEAVEQNCLKCYI